MIPALIPNEPILNRQAIQAAVDAVADAGGGRVEIPPGRFLCGSIELKSGVELHLRHGARLIACDVPEAFTPMGKNDDKVTANTHFSALIQAKKATDIAITGTGTIDGGGTPESTPDWATAQKMFRPAVVYFEDCQTVNIERVVIRNAKWWTLHLRRCDDTMIRGIRIFNTWPNSDGIDPDGCRRMIISDCHLDCGDDCIVLKSTQGDACEDIVVSNCVMVSTCAAFKLGTESFGQFRNISVTNCTTRANVGVGLYLKDGGSMDNVLVGQITFEGESDFPILVDATARDYRGQGPGSISNVRIQNCAFRGPGRVWLGGTSEQPLQNISLADIDWMVTAPLPEELLPRPLGSARTIIDPNRPDFESNRAHIIAVWVEGLCVNNVRLVGECSDRELLWQNPIDA